MLSDKIDWHSAQFEQQFTPAVATQNEHAAAAGEHAFLVDDFAHALALPGRGSPDGTPQPRIGSDADRRKRTAEALAPFPGDVLTLAVREIGPRVEAGAAAPPPDPFGSSVPAAASLSAPLTLPKPAAALGRVMWRPGAF